MQVLFISIISLIVFLLIFAVFFGHKQRKILLDKRKNFQLGNDFTMFFENIDFTFGIYIYKELNSLLILDLKEENKTRLFLINEIKNIEMFERMENDKKEYFINIVLYNNQEYTFNIIKKFKVDGAFAQVVNFFDKVKKDILNLEPDIMKKFLDEDKM